MLAQIAAQSLHLRQDELRVVKQRLTGGRWAHASTMSLQQSRSEHLLHPFHACACRRERDACARSANCNAALLHYGGEQAQVGKIKMHGASPRRVTILPMAQTKAELSKSLIGPFGTARQP